MFIHHMLKHLSRTQHIAGLHEWNWNADFHKKMHNKVEIPLNYTRRFLRRTFSTTATALLERSKHNSQYSDVPRHELTGAV